MRGGKKGSLMTHFPDILCSSVAASSFCFPLVFSDKIILEFYLYEEFS